MKSNIVIVVGLMVVSNAISFLCGIGFGRASVPRQVNIVTYHLLPKEVPPVVYLPFQGRPPHGGVQTPIQAQMPVNAKETPL